MKIKNKKHLNIIGTFLVIGVFLACTSNPFFKDNYYNLEKIRGRIILSDGFTPDSVFIWLDGLDLHTFSDVNGDFSLIIPPPEMQEGQAGLNGIYPLYFYCANYGIDSIPVTLTEGYLEKSQKNIDNDGQLRNPVTLEKLLDFTTEITPAEISNDWHDTVEVDVRLYSYVNSLPVTCFIWNKPFGATTITYQSGVILRPIDSNETEPILIYNDNILYYTYYLPAGQETVWPIRFYLDARALSPGEYEVLQFCWVNQEDIPDKLMNFFGENWDYLDSDYLKIPMKRSCAVLTILP